MNQYMPTGDRDEPPTIGKYDMFFKVRPDTSGTGNGSNKGKHILLANNFKAKALQKAYGKPQNVKITKSKSSAQNRYPKIFQPYLNQHCFWFPQSL